ncbi:MAG TPA: fibronectin type III domain-containing protein, partial [Planctomycetota bacterium]|nr:fibronectin type III domain-containing protein [Planctomycetota bacterium]HOE86747.1 fibronectin type III domain-containing protein [Planctomycetota bacterium]HPL60244.1 fibronectin type III domain-containing protein [Planctomycetota bacterium]HQG86259.1 fibronectin type III domain-containing protein [Planctomycetota bacterium]HQJ54520.1 fibronectin type III domain-containing protein [Planctomycetota bacterium]
MRIAPACVVSFCLAAALQGAAPARTPITCGPYLQSPGATDMTIMWETAAPAAGKLLYGTTPEYGWSFFEPEAVVLHAVALSDLQPGTRYHYKVLPTLPAEEAHARTGTFVTAP